ncbi:hypothetical protein ON010_g18385 [Phytophthora cinnamomi]|nr:hypothetical protein ON010_g18385 [Phytophthora cinnamomi]
MILKRRGETDEGQVAGRLVGISSSGVRLAGEVRRLAVGERMIFTASDGKTFEDRAAWRLYEFELTYTFRNKTSETLTKLPGQIEGKQLRTRDCSSCSIYLYSLTDPIIETSQDITFAPFNGAYCGIERNFTDARLEPINNHWSQVYDFNDPDKTGCNWRILKHEEEAAPWVIDIEPQVPGAAASLGACVNPVARDAGFIQYADSSSSASGGMQSFTFSTSQKEATKVVQATMDNTPVAPSIPAPPAPPVAPTASAAPPPVVEAPSILPPPAPVEAPTVEKQATVTAPEHVAPPPAMPPVLPAVEGADLTTKGPEEPAVDTVVEQVTEMMGMM